MCLNILCYVIISCCLLCLGKQIRSYEALDGKNPITAVTTMPAPHCSVVFGSADSVLRFIDPRKPGLQVAILLKESQSLETLAIPYQLLLRF